MLSEDPFFQQHDTDIKPTYTTPIVQEVNSDDEEEKAPHPRALREQINLDDDTLPLQKQKTPIDLQNTPQVKITQRKQQLPPLKHLPALPRVELTLTVAQPPQNQGQARGQDPIQHEPEQQKQSQAPVQVQPIQVKVVSSPKPKPQKARCRKLCQVPNQICQINMSSVYDKRAFFMSPCPPGVKMQCCFKRYRGCFSHRYECYLNENQYMMSATREDFSIAKNFSISFNPNYKKKDPSSYLGKITANLIGTEFEIFGQEESVSYKTTSLKNLGAVIHPEKVDMKRMPRKFKAYIPEVDETTAEAHAFSTGKESILNKWKNEDRSNIYDWHNKEPKWSSVYQAHILNFGNRATQASVKNFLMIDEFDDERIFLLLGKRNRDTFNMDFEWPLSPFQAFAICITSFAHKKIPE